MKSISLYTGAGGLDLGFEAAGFETAIAVEMDGHAVRTLQDNRDWVILHDSIQNLKSDEILKTGKLQNGEADILIGGPPCQPFSKSAYWVTGDTKRLNDPRASTLEHYLRVLRDTQPRAFLVENVPGLGYKSKDEGLRLLERTIEDINQESGLAYTAQSRVLNAADFGVPQERQRLFIIGHREGTHFDFPSPTHGLGEDCEPFGKELPKPLTAWDAIGDLEDDDDPQLALSGKWADLLPSIPEGMNYLHHTDRGEGLPLFGWRTRFWSFLLKLAKNRTSWTITAQPGSATGPFHWKNRRLSSTELSRLQTFPDDYRILGGKAAVQRQLGNAVPCVLGELLAREIRNQLLDQTIVGHRKLLGVPRGTPPPPEPVQPVMEKYSELVGDYSDHPGTGQGPGALRRVTND